MEPEALSVLVIPIPEAEALVGDIRRAHDPSGREGMPPHVTVLTPFVPLSRWDTTHAERLARALDGITPFGARFRGLGRFGTTTLFLVPEPQEPFRRIASRVATAFPEWPPYGGAYAEMHPHLTLAHGVPADVLTALETRLRGAVAIEVRVSDLALFSRGPDGRWQERRRVALGR